MMSFQRSLTLVLTLTLLLMPLVSPASACMPMERILGNGKVRVVDGKKYAETSSGERSLIVRAERQLSEGYDPQLVYCSEWESLEEGSTIVWGEMLKSFQTPYVYDCMKLF